MRIPTRLQGLFAKLRVPKKYWPLAALPVVALLAWCLTRESGKELSYGRFKRLLNEGQVRSVTLGPNTVTGELKPAREGERPVKFRAARGGLESDKDLIALLDQHVPDGNYSASSGATTLENAAVSVMVGMSVVALVLLIGRRSGGMGSALAFARSRHKVFQASERPITFEDVAGNEEAVEELREVVQFLKTPEKFQKIGGRIPKGILLVGPPGTGKTLLAKAIAGEAGVPFFALSGSEFVEMFVGVGASRVRSLFSQAAAKTPSLIFIDELDALGKSRGNGGTGGQDERDQTLNQLLVEMDGFESNRGLILIAATNRPETLDPALVRPGRFDRQIVVDRPDIQGRESILRVHARSVAIDDEVNLRQIAAMTPGFVGAELANLVNEAALLAVRKGRETVSHVELCESVERVIAGPEKRQRVIREEEKLRIAYHEAGHALVSRSLPNTDPVQKVSILGRGNGALGYTLSLPESDRFLHTRSWLEDMIRTLLGGTVAEEIVYGEISDGAASDIQRVTTLARKMVIEFGMSAKIGRVSYQNEGRSPFLPGGGASNHSWSEETAREIDLEVRKIVDENLEVTRSILQSRRGAFEEITSALMARESLDERELEAILVKHQPMTVN